MKFELTRKKNIFDFLDDDCENDISANVVEDIGVNSSNVRNIAFEKLGLEKKKKSGIKKRITVSLIAAAVAAAVVGTAAVGASGTFTAAFSEYIAGEPANGVFSGGNVSAKSDIVDIDFRGVTGDEHSAIISMSMTKKDGTAFIEDMSDTFIETFSEYRPFDADWRDYQESNYEQKFHCTSSLAHNIENLIRNRQDFEYWTALDYSFGDNNRTLNLYAEYGNNDINIKGERLTVSLENLYVSHIDQVLYTADDFNSYDEWMEFRENPETYKELNRKYQGQFGENQTVRITPRWDKIVIATKYTIPLNYEVSVGLNYKTIDKDFIVTKEQIYMNDAICKVRSITAGAFGMNMEVTLSEEEFAKHEIAAEEDDLTITLKDGRNVLAHCTGMSGEKISENEYCEKFTFEFNDEEKFRSGDDYARYTLDPNDIVSIKAADMELLAE